MVEGDIFAICDAGESDGCLVPSGCSTQQPSTTFIPPQMVMVLDKSGSMFSNSYDHDGDSGTADVTRWNALHQAVSPILNTYDGRINFGVKLFPSVSSLSCTVDDGVDVGCAPDNGATILASIPAATANSNGYTPSGTALEEAIEYLNTAPILAGGPRGIIFMADGSTSTECGEPDEWEEIAPLLVEAYLDDGISTYVVGINSGSSGTDTELSQFAIAGGSPAGDFALVFEDDFEDGDISDWTMSGDAGWTVDATWVPSSGGGSFAAHNLDIGNSDDARMGRTVTMPEAGFIYADIHISTESGDDYLEFYVDGSRVGSRYSGTVGWERVAWAIPAGTHTIRFDYDKDGSNSSGDDTVWIDNVAIYTGKAFHNAQNTQELYDAMDEIIDSVVTCDIGLSVAPPFPDQVDVKVSGNQYVQISEAECQASQDGWYYSSPHTTITLCGTACEDFKALSTPTAAVTYFCSAG